MGSGKNFKETPEGFQLTETKDDAEARKDLWSMEGDFVFRHHVEPRVLLYVPKEETFPIPLNYIDVTGATHTNLDVLQEKRVDDCWNVDVNRSLTESWKGFMKFTHSVERTTFQGKYMARGAARKNSSTCQT